MTDFISHSDGTIVHVAKVEKQIRHLEDRMDQAYMMAEAYRNHDEDASEREFDLIQDLENMLTELYWSINRSSPFC